MLPATSLMRTCAMKCLIVIFLCFTSTAIFGQSTNRRGSGVTRGNARTQFQVVDSDDNLDIAPVYNFVDTAFGTWTRISTFTGGTDDGYAFLPASTPASAIQWYQFNAHLTTTAANRPYVTTNGFIALDTMYRGMAGGNGVFNSPANQALPTTTLPQVPAVAALWADCELRTSGDSSKIFVRTTTDSCYITYYNLALKGTNGKIRATFQVAFTSNDTSVTINYKSFDGSIQGISAAQIWQKHATIGVQNSYASLATNYLDRGRYYATGTSSTTTQNLHNQLAVKFIRRQQNLIQVISINNPPYEHYELGGNTMAPSITVENLTDTSQMVYFQNTVKNLGTGITVYSRQDSLLVLGNSQGTLVGSTMAAIAFGSYRLTTTITDPKIGPDVWTADNTLSRTFCYFQSATSGGLFEDFTNGINYAVWSPVGAKAVRDDSVMYDPIAPRSATTGALLLDRRDIDGNYYNVQGAGDTMSSAPLNLSGLNTVYLTFSYQRGVKTDSSQAGIMNRILSGPERTITGASGVIQQGDSLVIEAIQSSSVTLNPTSWVQIGVIDGGLDFAPQQYRILLGSAYLHDHFRFRFRLKAHDNSPAFGLPVDDDDSWVIDGVQVFGTTSKTDLAVLGADLGNGIYTHIPRSVNGLTPHVHIANNGTFVTSAVYVARMVIKDQLNRIVYFRTESFTLPVSRADSTIAMPIWPIAGSQGGTFSVYVALEQLIFDYNHGNDTNTFTRKMYIDDVYAIDDASPDTVGSLTAAHNEFYYDFTPFASDSLRGTDFYMLSQFGGTMSWNLAIKRDTTTIANRAFGATSTTAGFVRGSFTPVYLTAGTTYRLHYTETAGPALGGDASKALVWPTPDNTAYQALHPEIDTNFYEPGQVNYVTSASTTNGSSGGLSLPMFRLVYTGSSTYLPVELVNFSGARLMNGNARLDWKTAKEENVFEFSIERQAGSDWLDIGSSLPKPGPNGGLYSLVDPSAPAGEVTYRLTEHDLNGSSHALGTVTINGANAAAAEMTLYPNPSTGVVRIDLQGIGSPESVRVIDLLGRVIFEDRAISGGIYQLDASRFANGMYQIEVATPAGVQRKPLTLVR